MYAFYSLLVYIFYTFFRKLPPQGQVGGEEGPSGPQQEARCAESQEGAATARKTPLWPELDQLDSSDDSDELSGSEDEARGSGDQPAEEIRSPLTDFLAFKQEIDRPTSDASKSSSPLLTVMSHLLSFLEHYSHMQRLQGKAQEYRAQLHRQERRRKRQLRNLRDAHRQRMRDKLTLIQSLETVICEQQSVLETLQTGSPLPTFPPPGVHSLVESISTLQGERAQLHEEIGGLRQNMEERERQRLQASGELHQQIEELKEKIRQREDEVAALRAEAGVTDAEKHIQSLSVENEGLKQSLGVTQGLLEKMVVVSTQPSTHLMKENEELRGRVQQLEVSLREKAEQLLDTKSHVDSLQWRREEEARQLEAEIHRLHLSLQTERKKPPEVQYVAQRVEVESPGLLRTLAQAEERNQTLEEQLSSRRERCRQLEEDLRRSEELSTNLQAKICSYEAEIEKLKDQLMEEIGQLEAQKEEAIREAAGGSEQHVDTLRDHLTGVQSRLASLRPVLKTIKTDYNSLRSQVSSFPLFYQASIREARRQICNAVTNVSEANRDLLQKYQREVQLRKKYHNQLVELKGNIRVLCRVRPHTEPAEQEGRGVGTILTDITDDTKLSVIHKGKERSFELDKVFLPQATQEEVFLEMEPVVTSCINGFNVCIFAYGQTGSGKTYTMEGTVEKPGINLQSLRALYQEMEARKGLWSYEVTLSMVEIYNEVIRDLLAKDPQDKLDIKLNPDGSGQLHVPGLTNKEVKSFRHIKKLLALGKRNRATFCTNMNERSSRSHALLTLTVCGQELASGTLTTGKLNLVDLAGSERVCKSGAEGERLKEAQNINKSLLALGEVIQALRAKQPHVPFRNSKLTYLLQDSLGKGNKTVMMVQVSPLEGNIGETFCSLSFAQRVCKVELGPASRKIDAAIAKAEL